MQFSRRSMLRMGMAGWLLPRLAWSGPGSEPDRCFLFVFCRGGWDTTRVFTPMLDHPHASPEEGAVESELNGIQFVDRESRPSVRAFFEQWGDRCCVLNGIEVRSVTHERCRRIMMTGSSDPARDDWAAHLASYAESSMPCPHLVLAGPAFTHAYSDRVVRMGSAGQLANLLDDSAFESSDMALGGLEPELQALAQDFVRSQSQGRLDEASGLQARTYLERHLQALDSIEALESLEEPLQSIDLGSGCSRDLIADAGQIFSCFERQISRCGMIEHLGWCDSGWDTHSQNAMQDWHFEDLFGELMGVLEDLETRTGPSGEPLSEQVTIVVLSEMGRHPVENSQAGKDHWTMTSAMLIGSGVQGGQVIGELDENALGQAVDLSTGGLSSTGEALLPGHLGATLMALADQDPAEMIDRAPILAALS